MPHHVTHRDHRGASEENDWRSAQPPAAFYATSLASERANPLARPLTDGVACAVPSVSSRRRPSQARVARTHGSVNVRARAVLQRKSTTHLDTDLPHRFLAAIFKAGHHETGSLSTELGVTPLLSFSSFRAC